MTGKWLEIDVRRRVGGLDLDVRLEISEPRCALFGPSGAGKSTLLRLVAGIERPDEGSIGACGRTLFDSSRRVDVPVHRRGAGLVFQHSALFPHMTVEQNLLFGIPGARTGDARVSAVAAEMGLAGLLGSMPHTLSGGERQRAALARTLLSPLCCALLDEPLSALDGPARESLRERAMSSLEMSGTPFLYVTHDLEEACAVADCLVVMAGGRIVQHGRPEDVLRCPADAIVADLTAVRNMLDAGLRAVEGDLARAACGAVELVFPAPQGADLPGRLKIGIRPEEVRILPRGGGGGRPNRFEAVVTGLSCAGLKHHIVVSIGEGDRAVLLRATMPDHPFRRMGIAPGAEVDVYIPPRCVQLIGV